MLFDRLATVVTKRYKLVIAIWIVALLIAVPAMLSVNEAIQYSSDMSEGGDYESTRAQKVIDANFQRSVANGTLIFVIQSDDVTDSATKNFVLDLEKRIRDDPNIKFKQDVSSIYSYYTQILSGAIVGDPAESTPGLASGLHQINQTVSLVWGIPGIHVGVWSGKDAQASGDPDAYAYSATVNYLNGLLSDAQTKQLALGYYGAFAQVWNGTAADPVLEADPVARAEYSVKNGGPSFIDAYVPDQQKQFMLAVVDRFNFTTGTDPEEVKSFAVSTVLAETAYIADTDANRDFLREVYELGPAPDAAAVAALAGSVVSSRSLDDLPIPVPDQLMTNFISSNGKTMLVMATFTEVSTYTEENGAKPLMGNVKIIRDLIKDLKPAGTTAFVTGDAALSQDMQESSESDMALIEPITIVIIVVLMGILFRSVLAQFLPLGAVGVAIGFGQAVVFIIGSTVAQIDSTVLTLQFSILMGVGTDYSIFLVTRYREERIRGATREQAVHTSVAWAGESIVTSGATVVIAFFAMSFSSFAMVQTMGLVLGISIIIALLIALTLVPAVLMVLGNRIFWPNTGERFKRFASQMMERKKAGNHGYFHRAATLATDHAVAVVLIAVLVSVPTTYIYLTQETSFDFIGTMGEPESIQGMNALADDFGAGRIMPTQVVISGDAVVYDGTTWNKEYLDAVDNITATIAANPGVQEVTGITRPFGTWVDYRDPALSVEEQAGMFQNLGDDHRSVLLTVILKEQPQKASSVAFMPDLRQEIADAKALQPLLASSTILVGGSTASLYDMSDDTSKQFINIQILVVLGIFVVLLIVLGSVLLPLFAIVSIAMSISWAFAITSLVFGAWLQLPILWIIPLVLFVMLMGIGMDYNVFILTRIREEVHKGKDTRTAVVDAVDWTGGIITALALIMAGAFGSIMISSNAMLQEFGFALCLAVLLDAMVVRTYIVPAALMLMGKWAWWAPGRLQREGRHEKMEAKRRDREEKAEQ